MSVEVTLAGKTYTTTADATGAWSVSVPAADKLGDGTYTPSIKYSDTFGQTKTAAGTAFRVDAAAPAAPVGALAAASDSGVAGDFLTKAVKPTIGGTAEADAKVEVTVNGKVYATTANAQGVWSVQVADALPDGSYTPSIKVTDGAGNSSTANGVAFRVDATAPASPTVALAAVSDSGTRGDNITSDTAPTLVGTAEAGATVQLTLNQKTYATTAGADGKWTLTLPDADVLPTGAYTPLVRVTDAAGNFSEAAGAPLSITAPSTVTKNIIVIDGPLANAKLYYDYNGNGVADEGEVTLPNGQKKSEFLGRTDQNGALSITYEPVDGVRVLVVSDDATVDVFTGNKFTLSLSAIDSSGSGRPGGVADQLADSQRRHQRAAAEGSAGLAARPEPASFNFIDILKTGGTSAGNWALRRSWPPPRCRWATWWRPRSRRRRPSRAKCSAVKPCRT